MKENCTLTRRYQAGKQTLAQGVGVLYDTFTVDLESRKVQGRKEMSCRKFCLSIYRL